MSDSRTIDKRFWELKQTHARRGKSGPPALSIALPRKHVLVPHAHCVGGKRKPRRGNSYVFLASLALNGAVLNQPSVFRAMLRLEELGGGYRVIRGCLYLERFDDEVGEMG
ncbi:hypothetical protein PAAG_12603 [Paracoccidioides lutzii Pb01]|uniref:Uncharacterized protein n=1 Tax=Paracoccidioides lutzii (strain ATCC MYA-826 / Pb01) TaxID=502779 RepID=A0A0A2V3M3_PARBA|nr:hypothetical protein PAAG_12603 [Paracoccidioides lutzii Pb01]KGQ00725.1 hypothetical protein PAAG_12603 [Paracoccidioides lutzii Pb01]